MYQVRIHGRGGKRVGSTAELLAAAASVEGAWAQASPGRCPDRADAPTVAYCRIDDVPLTTREPVTEPDCVIIEDATVGADVDVLAGLRPGGQVLVNSAMPVSTMGNVPAMAVPATDLALRHLGRPVPTAALVGAFAGLTGLLRIESVEAAIRVRFRARTARHTVASARAAYRLARAARKERFHA